MTRPELFTYPPEPHLRKHAPAGYKNYPEYKPWLRDEFEFRCVYCLQREMWSDPIEHIELPMLATVLAPLVQDALPGLTVVQLTDLKSVNVTAYVDEGAIDNVKIGQDVDVHIDAYSGTSFTGKVQRIVMATAGQFSLLPTQDNASSNFTKVGQRIPVVISLDTTSGKTIMPGMSVSVTIHIH